MGKNQTYWYLTSVKCFRLLDILFPSSSILRSSASPPLTFSYSELLCGGGRSWGRLTHDNYYDIFQRCVSSALNMLYIVVLLLGQFDLINIVIQKVNGKFKKKFYEPTWQVSEVTIYNSYWCRNCFRYLWWILNFFLLVY